MSTISESFIYKKKRKKESYLAWVFW